MPAYSTYWHIQLEADLLSKYQPQHRPVKNPYWSTTNSDGGDLYHLTLYQPYSNV